MLWESGPALSDGARCVEGHGINSARQLFGQPGHVCEALWELSRQFLVKPKKRFSLVLFQEISSILPLPWKGCAYPVIKRSWDDANGLCCLRLLSQGKKCLGTMSFSWCGKRLDWLTATAFSPRWLMRGVTSPGCWPTILVLAFLRMPGPCSRGWKSFPTKSSSVWLIPHTLEFRLRAVRNSWTTSGASASESSKNQHSSRTVMLSCPLLPDAREAIVVASSMLMAVSSLGSDLRPSILKKSQSLSRRIVVGWSKSLAYMPLSPVHDRSLMAARCASSIVRCIFSESRQFASSSRRSVKVGIGFDSWIARRLYTRGMASSRTFSSSETSEPGLVPIM
jgi:hypothetical protein